MQFLQLFLYERVHSPGSVPNLNGKRIFIYSGASDVLSIPLYYADLEEVIRLDYVVKHEEDAR